MNRNKTALEEKIKDNSRELEEKLYIKGRIQDFKLFNDEIAKYKKQYGFSTTKN